MFKECEASARSTGHKSCRQPAMANGRCRLHGGKSTGPRTEFGKQAMIRAKTKHGFYSAEAIAQRREARAMIRAMST